jgi:hypothetical protein
LLSPVHGQLGKNGQNQAILNIVILYIQWFISALFVVVTKSLFDACLEATAVLYRMHVYPKSPAQKQEEPQGILYIQIG